MSREGQAQGMHTQAQTKVKAQPQAKADVLRSGSIYRLRDLSVLQSKVAITPNLQAYRPRARAPTAAVTQKPQSTLHTPPSRAPATSTITTTAPRSDPRDVRLIRVLFDELYRSTPVPMAALKAISEARTAALPQTQSAPRPDTRLYNDMGVRPQLVSPSVAPSAYSTSMSAAATVEVVLPPPDAEATTYDLPAPVPREASRTGPSKPALVAGAPLGWRTVSAPRALSAIALCTEFDRARSTQDMTTPSVDPYTYQRPVVPMVFDKGIIQNPKHKTIATASPTPEVQFKSTFSQPHPQPEPVPARKEPEPVPPRVETESVPARTGPAPVPVQIEPESVSPRERPEKVPAHTARESVHVRAEPGSVPPQTELESVPAPDGQVHKGTGHATVNTFSRKIEENRDGGTLQHAAGGKRVSPAARSRYLLRDASIKRTQQPQDSLLSVFSSPTPRSIKKRAAPGFVHASAAVPCPSQDAISRVEHRQERESLAKPWSPVELQSLHDAHMQAAPAAPDFWEAVSAGVPGRTAIECRNQWFVTLPEKTEEVTRRKTSAIAHPQLDKRVQAAHCEDDVFSRTPERAGLGRVAQHVENVPVNDISSPRGASPPPSPGSDTLVPQWKLKYASRLKKLYGRTQRPARRRGAGKSKPAPTMTKGSRKRKRNSYAQMVQDPTTGQDALTVHTTVSPRGTVRTKVRDEVGDEVDVDMCGTSSSSDSD